MEPLDERKRSRSLSKEEAKYIKTGSRIENIDLVAVDLVDQRSQSPEASLLQDCKLYTCNRNRLSYQRVWGN